MVTLPAIPAVAPHGRRIAVVGLGHVGLNLAVAFGKKGTVLGFDINAKRIEELRAGHDRANNVTDLDLRTTQVFYSCDPSDLRAADFLIVAAPTPTNGANRRDVSPIQDATRTVAKSLAGLRTAPSPRQSAASCLQPARIVVYESTVSPGVTEEVCVPILEEVSGMKCGKDFFVGYSPEHSNPGNKPHTLENTVKVVSAQTPEVLEIVAEVYQSVVEAGVRRAASIKTAETAKVLENAQRDLNVALVNESAFITDRIGIGKPEVPEAAGNKRNSSPFHSGLAGGHCIGVNPRPLIRKDEELALIGRTMCEISHSLKNILSVTQGAAEVLDNHLQGGRLKAARETWTLVRRGMDRMNSLACAMLEYARSEIEARAEVQVNDIVQDVYKDLHSDMEKTGIRLELQIEPDLHTCLLQPAGLYDAVMNLAVNSRDALSLNSNGVIAIKTRAVSGMRVQVSVSDNGQGIPPELHERIFQPFFTTKGPDGNGMGLAMVEKFVRKMDGTIEMDSTPGQGAEIRLLFPSLSLEKGEEEPNQRLETADCRP